ncbi:TauD/TfdA dioxygenase family protein [Celeribacter indicus]|uniref:Taurine catabolism dioxygenase TauD/TfdA n=1 Tax=Celeribacter indicus TaxID=1208324 RepID=A0A0B5DZB6_9RHOB|nr:TauD/TfdA family dioxygenase [Celeribacter indicus]AJE48788.1 taurine catabolism dioxygenase TauD/TfdA [Celeribacter indicus]SDX59720.1 taurine dioxygenase [Celeribacter indicus]
MSIFDSAELTQLRPDLGTSIRGLSLPDCLSETFAQELRLLLADRGVVVFKDQKITPAEQVALTSLFGEPVPTTAREFPVPGHEQIAILSNIKVDGKPIGSTDAGRTWHTDAAFNAQPTSITVLHGLEVPAIGGGTAFGSLRRAYDSLTPEEIRSLRGKSAHYSIWKLIRARPDAREITPEEEAQRPPSSHPILRIHPETGRECIYINRGDCIGIDGFSDEDAQDFVDRMFAVACDPAHVYEHKWEAGDVLLWDNRIVLHIGTPYDTKTERRLIHRSWVKGEKPIAAVG